MTERRDVTAKQPDATDFREIDPAEIPSPALTRLVEEVRNEASPIPARAYGPNAQQAYTAVADREDPGARNHRRSASGPDTMGTPRSRIPAHRERAKVTDSKPISIPFSSR